MYIVTIDRPFYPSINYFEDYNKAKEYYHVLIEEQAEDGDAAYSPTVTLSQVVDSEKIKTSY